MNSSSTSSSILGFTTPEKSTGTNSPPGAPIAKRTRRSLFSESDEDGSQHGMGLPTTLFASPPKDGDSKTLQAPVSHRLESSQSSSQDDDFSSSSDEYESKDEEDARDVLIQQLVEKFTMQTNMIKDRDARIQDLSSEIDGLKKDRFGSDATIANLTAKIDGLTEKIAQNESEYRKSLSSLQVQIKGLKAKNDALTRKLASFEQREKKERVAKLQKEFQLPNIERETKPAVRSNDISKPVDKKFRKKKSTCQPRDKKVYSMAMDALKEFDNL
jgi:predicted  nucleic acid-binding Zn-ribbon protein